MRPGFSERSGDFSRDSMDWQKKTPSNETDQRHQAENAVRQLLLGTLTGIDVEKATPDEDAGVTFTGQHSQIKGQQTDLVLMREQRPFLALQITTGQSTANKEQKMRDQQANPFLFIRGGIVPRVTVALDWDETKKLLADKNPAKHPELLKQFFMGAINSLEFDQLATTDKLKKQLARDALTFIRDQEKQIKAKKEKPTTIH